MINKLDERTAEQFGLNFDDLLNDFYDDSLSVHRGGSTFYKQSIVEINEKDYPNVDKQLYGFWETNEYIWDDNYGFDKTEIHKLTKVEPKERTVIQKYWEKV